MILTLSNHAPITFNLSSNNIIHKHVPKVHTVFKWCEEHKENYLNDLRSNINSLSNNLSNKITNQSDPDDSVSSFTEFLTKEGNKYFKRCCKINAQNTNPNSNQKEWFDAICNQKKHSYLQALNKYNFERNKENRESFLTKRKEYKNYCKRAKRKYNIQFSKSLNDLKHKKPKEFWNLFKHKESINSDAINIETFREHFENLSSFISHEEDTECTDFIQNYDNTPNTNPTFEELDLPISIEEIRNACKRLNRNKACSLDNSLYEYFIYGIDILEKPLEMLFNYILNKQIFPRSWSRGAIIPVFKKGDNTDPNNYRGITLISCFAKLFMSIINDRLKCWSVQNSILSDAQFGFKSNYSTVDAIFLLNAFIEHQIQKKEKLYCCFIDFRKCFDSIYRDRLWCKLLKQGIDGKIFKVIRSMYNDIMLCVKHVNSMSDFFQCNVRLLQGEISSPILFSLFINDIELFLLNNEIPGLTVQQLSIFLLLFADDSVLISETAEGLQKLLDSFELYCRK